MYKERRGFSLMELIIVMAVIMILAAMIFPSVHVVRARAKRMTCARNLGQLGGALLAYADDHSGILPGLGNPDGPAKPDEDESSDAWFNVLPPLLGEPSMRELVDREEMLLPGSGVRSVFLCPSCPVLNGVDKDSDYFGSYALNRWAERANGRRLRIHQVENASIFALFADNSTGEFGGDDCFALSFTHAKMMAEAVDGLDGANNAFRHRGKANICFADGNVRSYKIDEVYDGGMSDSDNYGGIIWNIDSDDEE